MVRKMGATLIEKGAAIWNDPAKAVALAEQGSGAHRGAREACADAAGFADPIQGEAGCRQSKWRGPNRCRSTTSRPSPRRLARRSTTCSCHASPARLRGYLAAKGDATDGVMIRALVPVNLRPLEEAYRLGNQFGLVFLDLPIGIENPVERLYAVRANMNALKGSFQPVIALGLLAAMGAGPKALQEELLHALARNGTAVMTNVPGPPEPLYFAGAAIDRFLFWVPQSGDIGMGVSILSYAGQVQFGLITDRGLCPDPDLIIAQFGPEFEKLRARHTARPVAARRRSRSRHRGASGNGVGTGQVHNKASSTLCYVSDPVPTRARTGRARRPDAPSHPRVSLRPLPGRASRPRPCGPCPRA